MGIYTKAITVLARNLGLVDPRLYNFVGTGPTYAGENVTVDSAMQLDVVWACVRLIAQTIATLPLFLYKRDAKGQGIIDDVHQLYRILHDRPNADMTATEFWEAIVSAILLWGNAYAVIEKIGARIVALTPMRPDRVIIERLTSGALVYTYSWNGIVEKFNEDEILHIKGFSLDGFIGISPVSQLRNVIASASAAERASGAFFKNSMQPSVIMKAPAYLTDPQRARAKVMLEQYAGAINTGKVPLLEGGWDVIPLSLKPEDAQLLETRNFHVEQLCRAFDTPPPMIGHMDKSTSWGTGLEQMMLWFLTFCIRPHLKRIEHAISKSLFTAAEKLSHYAEFNVDGLLRADSAGRSALFASQAQNGISTRNELRALDNKPPLPGGDVLTVQSNLIPIDMLGKIPPSQAKTPPDPVGQ